jgi:hypothetical protein
MKKIVNLTPHAVRIIGDNNETLAEYPSQGSARVETRDADTGITVGPAPVIAVVFGETTGLPEPDEETIYIVSFIVAKANPHRKDLVVPNTDPKHVVRDASGQILGVRCWAKH